jgi:hypothetical protein
VQVAYLFRHTILKGLEPGSGDSRDVGADYRFVVFKCLDTICADGQLLMDLFVNFDCDPDRTDTVLLERMFKALNNIVANPDTLQDPSAGVQLPTSQRSMLRYAALTALVQAMRSLYDWHESLSGVLLFSAALLGRHPCAWTTTPLNGLIVGVLMFTWNRATHLNFTWSVWWQKVFAHSSAKDFQVLAYLQASMAMAFVRFPVLMDGPSLVCQES